MYAKRTHVPIDQSKQEIERLLLRYGADQVVSGFEQKRAMVAFRYRTRYVRFILTLPARDDREFTHKKARSEYSSPRARTQASAQALYDGERRRRWRALCLILKAKLEAVASGIAEFETEFLGHIVMPDGRTVGEHVAPQIASAYETGNVPLLLPAYGGSEEARR